MSLVGRLGAALRRVDHVWVDWLPVAGLLALSQVDPNLAASDAEVPPLAGGLFAVATTLPLGWRRHHPGSVIIAITAAVVVWALLVGPLITFSSFLAVMVAMFAVGVHGDRREVVTGITAAALAVTVVALTDDQPASAFEWVFPTIYFGGAMLLGRAMRRREQRTQMLARLNAELARERDRNAELAAAQERTRIAREMHDVIAHGVGVIVVQAEAAEEVLTTRPDRARGALREIQTVGRQTLTELRHLLGVLRHDSTGPPADVQPTLAELDRLADRMAATGLRVELRTEGRPRPLPAPLELTAYRLVQEALTNTHKHAQATVARVVVRYHADQLEVEVTDDGGGTSVRPSTRGRGLIGMHERVHACAGSLEAGGTEAGFVVRAVLPTAGAPS